MPVGETTRAADWFYALRHIYPEFSSDGYHELPKVPLNEDDSSGGRLLRQIELRKLQPDFFKIVWEFAHKSRGKFKEVQRKKEL